MTGILRLLSAAVKTKLALRTTSVVLLSVVTFKVAVPFPVTGVTVHQVTGVWVVSSTTSTFHSTALVCRVISFSPPPMLYCSSLESAAKEVSLASCSTVTIFISCDSLIRKVSSAVRGSFHGFSEYEIGTWEYLNPSVSDTLHHACELLNVHLSSDITFNI